MKNVTADDVIAFARSLGGDGAIADGTTERFATELADPRAAEMYCDGILLRNPHDFTVDGQDLVLNAIPSNGSTIAWIPGGPPMEVKRKTAKSCSTCINSEGDYEDPWGWILRCKIDKSRVAAHMRCDLFKYKKAPLGTPERHAARCCGTCKHRQTKFTDHTAGTPMFIYCKLDDVRTEPTLICDLFAPKPIENEEDK